MTPERFNELLNGPLRGPLPMFSLTRLTLALLYVVTRCGEQGERALEEYCRDRELQDQRNGEGG